MLLQSHVGLLDNSDLTRLEGFLREARTPALADPLAIDVIIPLVEALDGPGRSRANVALVRWSADTKPSLQRSHVRKLGSDLQRIANRKLLILDAAEIINDLRIPGNRLEQLHGNRTGQHSIRINDQWRICFTWTSAGPADVRITDYH